MTIFVTPLDIFAAFVIALTFLVVLIYGIVTALRQSRCEHLHVTETRACDAICNHCGKNLGFIQNWRDKQ